MSTSAREHWGRGVAIRWSSAHPRWTSGNQATGPAQAFPSQATARPSGTRQAIIGQAVLGPGRPPWLGDALRQSFAGHGHDVAGTLLIVVGVVAALGIYVDGAGPVGAALATGLGAAVGLASWVIPPLLVALGVVVLRGRRPDAEPAAIVRPWSGPC